MAKPKRPKKIIPAQVLAKAKDPKTGQFVPGHTGMGGRPKGARNKLGEAFLEDLHAEWKEGGTSALKQCRLLMPDKFCKIVADLLQKEIVITREDEAFDKLSDDEISEVLADVLSRRRVAEARSAGSEDTPGAKAAARARKPDRVH